MAEISKDWHVSDVLIPFMPIDEREQWLIPPGILFNPTGQSADEFREHYRSLGAVPLADVLENYRQMVGALRMVHDAATAPSAGMRRQFFNNLKEKADAVLVAHDALFPKGATDGT